MAGSISLAPPSFRSLHPDVDQQERTTGMTSAQQTAMPAMYVDRAVLQPAMAHLPPRGVDAVLIAVMPVLLLELAVRAAIRSVRQRAGRRGTSG